MNYKIYNNVTETHHKGFNEECNNIDISNFRTNPLMKSIVQNCSKESGLKQYEYINNNFADIMSKINYDLLIKYDSIGGSNTNELINGLTPKVFSYIREAILFYKYYIQPNNITHINKLLMIGSGYGSECCILYLVCQVMGVKIDNIIGLDMPNVAKLQNQYFKLVNMDNICKSYSYEECKITPDIVYSNCCLSELTCEINYNYYNDYCKLSKGFYIVWGVWAAEIPEYYKPYVNKEELYNLINNGLYNNPNAIIVK